MALSSRSRDDFVEETFGDGGEVKVAKVGASKARGAEVLVQCFCRKCHGL